LAQLLADRGVTVHRTTALTDVAAGRTVVIAFPDDYSTAQLHNLATGRRLIVLRPGPTAMHALAPDLQAHDVDDSAPTVQPGCGLPGPQAAGAVRFPDGTHVYDGASCYGGRVAIAPSLVVLGSDALVRNDQLARDGVAALDINAITADGTVRDVVWLLPGADAHGDGSPSVWLVLPDWAPLAVTWALVVGVLIAFWRGRRLGPVVTEPLPVVVRAAEITEGHGRLYRRSAARDAGAAREHAAASLRAGALRRLRTRLGLRRDAPAGEVAAELARTTGHPAAAMHEMLAGPAPTDDAMLIDLATSLHDLGGPRP
jgi:hypothetical protein